VLFSRLDSFRVLYRRNILRLGQLLRQGDHHRSVCNVNEICGKGQTYFELMLAFVIEIPPVSLAFLMGYFDSLAGGGLSGLRGVIAA